MARVTRLPPVAEVFSASADPAAESEEPAELPHAVRLSAMAEAVRAVRNFFIIFLRKIYEHYKDGEKDFKPLKTFFTKIFIFLYIQRLHETFHAQF